MDLIGAIRTSELALVYQPQVSASCGTVKCVEALLRHDHPRRGRIGAGEVLACFDTPELLEELDWWVLRRACQDALNWQSLPVSINISATQFHKPDFATRVLNLVSEIGIGPERVELEIVEDTFVADFAAATTNISILRNAGLKIALDDFGKGYSSLTYLIKIPVDKIKIDKCFVDNCDTVPSAAVIQAIVAVARAIGLKVTAEGVETAEQHRFLRAVGCHFLQGYLFAAAASVDGITRLLHEQDAALSAKDVARPAAAKAG